MGVSSITAKTQKVYGLPRQVYHIVFKDCGAEGDTYDESWDAYVANGHLNVRSVQSNEKPEVSTTNSDTSSPFSEKKGYSVLRATDNINLRAEPNPNSENVLGSPPNDYIPKNTQIKVQTTDCVVYHADTRNSEWCKAEYADNKGWVNLRYLVR
jgi:hypothetical protein